MERTKLLRTAVGLLIALVVSDVVLLVVFEAVRPRTLSWDGLWNARTGLWSVLLLLNNLALVWWYAYITAVGVATAQNQLRMAESQAMLASRQFEASIQPCVVLERARLGDRGDKYMIKNLGPGSALNIGLLSESEAGSTHLVKLGALDAKTQIEMPFDIESAFRTQTGGETVIILIAHSASQLRPLVLSVNRKSDSRVSHSIHFIESAAIGPSFVNPIGGFVVEKWPSLRNEFLSLSRTK